jgi:hypothetical protein
MHEAADGCGGLEGPGRRRADRDHPAAGRVRQVHQPSSGQRDVEQLGDRWLAGLCGGDAGVQRSPVPAGSAVIVAEIGVLPCSIVVESVQSLRLRCIARRRARNRQTGPAPVRRRQPMARKPGQRLPILPVQSFSFHFHFYESERIDGGIAADGHAVAGVIVGEGDAVVARHDRPALDVVGPAGNEGVKRGMVIADADVRTPVAELA